MDLLFAQRDSLLLFDDPQTPSETLQRLLTRCVMPGILLVTRNQPLWQALFAFTRELGVQRRFSLYEDFLRVGLLGDARVRFQCGRDLTNIKKYFKNMVDQKVKGSLTSHNFGLLSPGRSESVSESALFDP